MKLDILAIGVHPDDLELCCVGTLLKHIDLGYKTGILDLTRGELGTRGNAQLRLQEARSSADIMGVEIRENLNLRDGFFRNTVENQLEIIKVLRHYQPDIVMINAPSDRHPDHGRAAKMCAEACYYTGLVKIKTSRDGVSQAKWRPRLVLNYIQDRYHKPDFVVDIGAYQEKKLACIRAFKSQFFDPDSKEPETPISKSDFIDFIVARSKEMGRPAGMEYAEGFIAERTIGVENLFDLV